MIELIPLLEQNNIMKNRLFIIIFISFLFITSDCYGKTNEKSDVNSSSFMELGRYVETFETNDETENNAGIKETDENFENEAINDVAKIYENNAVELKLDEIDDNAINTVNSERIFKLHINETQYNIEQSIKNENMIWDSSKSFSQAFLNDSRHMAPIPGVINSQSINAEVSPVLSASFGQTYLFDSLGPSLLFIRANESTYNTGAVVTYKGDFLNLSAGSFSSSYNHASSGGAILSTNSINLPKSAGSMSFGGGYFSNEMYTADKTTCGLFSQYAFKRFKFNAQIGQSKFSNHSDYDTSIYFSPELQLSKSLSLKTRFIRNLSQDTMQDELVLTYKPFKHRNSLEIELNASNQYTQDTTIKQRLKLTTSFKI